MGEIIKHQGFKRSRKRCEKISFPQIHQRLFLIDMKWARVPIYALAVMSVFQIPILLGAEDTTAKLTQRGTWTGTIKEVGFDFITMTLTASSQNNVALPIDKPSDAEFYGSTGFTLDGNSIPTRGLVGLLKPGVNVTLHWNGERSRDLRLFHAVETGDESPTLSMSSTTETTGAIPQPLPKAPLQGDGVQAEPDTTTGSQSVRETGAPSQPSPPRPIPGFQAYPLDKKWTDKLHEKPGTQQIEESPLPDSQNGSANPRPQISSQQPSQTIPPPLEEQNRKLPKRKSLGLQVYQLEQEMAKKLGLGQRSGFAVEMVADSSPAAEAGLQRGDVIVELSGKPAKSAEFFDDAVSRWRGGEELEFTILRQKNFIDPPERLSLRVATIPD